MLFFIFDEKMLLFNCSFVKCYSVDPGLLHLVVHTALFVISFLLWLTVVAYLFLYIFYLGMISHYFTWICYISSARLHLFLQSSLKYLTQKIRNDSLLFGCCFSCCSSGSEVCCSSILRTGIRRWCPVCFGTPAAWLKYILSSNDGQKEPKTSEKLEQHVTALLAALIKPECTTKRTHTQPAVDTTDAWVTFC